MSRNSRPNFKRHRSHILQSWSLEERVEYLRLTGEVGEATFGFDRYLNQRFYRSPQWMSVRNIVITRDNGLDLGCRGYPIFERPIIHHMNPMTVEDLENANEDVLDPDYLILCSIRTHNAIHFGHGPFETLDPVVRKPGDTKLW